MSKIYTVHNYYYGTGEGSSYQVLFTRGYGPNTPQENALNSFRDAFGVFATYGATVEEGLVLDFQGSEFLISDRLRKFLLRAVNDPEGPGGLEYRAEMHINFA